MFKWTLPGLAVNVKSETKYKISCGIEYVKSETKYNISWGIEWQQNWLNFKSECKPRNQSTYIRME